MKRYLETHFEVVAFIMECVNDETTEAYAADQFDGRRGLYDLARIWTDQFESEHKNTDWDETDFWLTIDEWLEKNKPMIETNKF